MKLHIQLSVAWDKTVVNKQTLFAVNGEKDNKKAKKGVPEATDLQNYTLRATKGVNMHPFPKLELKYEEGGHYAPEEELRLSVVNAVDKLPPNMGSCTSCNGSPLLAESKQFQLYKVNGEVRSKIRGGVLEFSKLQIGCCTGPRGHGSPFVIKVEFISENSQLRGCVVYSPPIDVGAKGPFAKIVNQKNAIAVPPPVEIAPVPAPVEQAPEIPSGMNYPGAKEMVDLLRKLNLSQYIDLFLKEEIDIQAFFQLTHESLQEIGISKVGPRLKILNEIETLKPKQEPSPVTSPASTETAESSPLVPTEIPVQVTTVTYSHEESSPGLPANSSPNETQANNAGQLLNPTNSTNTSSLSSPLLASLFQDDTLGMADLPSKRRKLDTFASYNSLTDLETEATQTAMYLYLSNIVPGNNSLKKTLFMVKSELPRSDTENVVAQIQTQVVNELLQKGKYVFCEGKPQLMLLLESKPNNMEFVAKAPANESTTWNVKKGDFIKIDNHHNVDISIVVHYYYITCEKTFIEDFKSPKKYPTLFPGGSLEIGMDDQREGRIALSGELEIEPTETFAITKNGKLMLPPLSSETSSFSETCNFSFKRRKDINMKKAESFDDFEKNIFLSKCLDPSFS